MEKTEYDRMYCYKVNHPLGPLNWVRNKEILKIFNKIPKNKLIEILDLGCGKAYLDVELAKIGCYVTAVDISYEAILFAKNLAKKNGVGNSIEFIQSDLTKLRLKKKYDIIICSEVIEHFKDDDAIVSIVYTNLKKGGWGIITTPYNPKLWGMIDEASGHYHKYSTNQISKRNNFLIKDVLIYGFPLLRLFKFFYYKTLLKKKNVKKNECEFHTFGYIPKGALLKLYRLFSPILFKIFHFDSIFNFSKKGIGIVVLVKKPY